MGYHVPYYCAIGAEVASAKYSPSGKSHAGFLLFGGSPRFRGNADWPSGLLMPRIPTLRPRVQVARQKIQSARIERERGASWDAFRRRWLSDHPLCVMCQQADPPRVTAALELDHIVPLWKGGGMYQVQGLCRDCHKVKSAAEAVERSRG